MGKILTISIAAYNVSASIEKTIKSLIVKKDYMDKLDIIVVNDGSKDNTADIAKKYSNKYKDSITVIDKDNGGYGSTINSALEIARGKYFKLLDGDDCYITENLTQFIDFLDECESDIVLTNFDTINVKNNEKTTINRNSDIVPLIADNDFRDDIAMHELTVKTDILRSNKVKISEHCFYTDNEIVFYSILYSNTISKCNLSIYSYQVGDETQSTSLNGWRKHYKDIITVSIALYKSFMDNKDNLYGKKRLLLERYIKMVSHGVYYSHLLLENKKEAVEALKCFDKLLKDSYSEIYKMTFEVKKIWLLRITHYYIFNIYSCYLIKKYSNTRIWKNENKN